MYPVTQEFNQKILQKVRQVYGKVQVDYTDPFLDQSIATEANELANISHPQQTTDGIQEPPVKVASLDGSWILDGSYGIVDNESHIGWWGSQLSGQDGSFVVPYPKLTVIFQSRPIHSLKVIGDKLRVEYPVDFNIKIYDDTNNLLHTEIIAGNTEIMWEKEIDVITQAAKLELEIIKWSSANRQVKILEFFTSVQEIYEGKELIKVELLEERDTGSEGIPVGNIASNELTLILNNKSRKFDAGNTQSPLYNLLKPNRRIRAWLGIEKDDKSKEFVPLGTFWSGDWDAPKDGVTATVKARDRFKFLEETTYENNDIRVNLSLYDLAVDILVDAGLKSEEYWVDESLKDYIIPYVKMETQSHREALRKVANACLGQVYCDRDNIIKIESSKQAEELYDIQVSENANISYPNQITDGILEPDALYAVLDDSWALGGSYELVPSAEGPQMGWWGSQVSDENGYFMYPYPKAEIVFLSKAVEMVRVVGDNLRGEYPIDFTLRVYDLSNNILAEHYITDNNQVFTEILIPENPTNATKITLEITRWSHSGRQSKILEFKDIPYKLEITPKDYFKKNNPAKHSNMANYVEVVAHPIDAQGNSLDEIKVIVKDVDSITKNGQIKYVFPNNPLIQTQELAQEIANAILINFKDPRRDLTLEWRGNPALLLGNIITVDDSKEKNDYKTVKQEFEYAGYLRMKTFGRRL
ncbi:hypothetical protein [Proteiniborus sp.]|uniref:hypothetical protein n=1 Tax=Proteiniborus sp. TaxID=2079015 RepID=UPI00332B3C76